MTGWLATAQKDGAHHRPRVGGGMTSWLDTCRRKAPTTDLASVGTWLVGWASAARTSRLLGDVVLAD